MRLSTLKKYSIQTLAYHELQKQALLPAGAVNADFETSKKGGFERG